MIFYSNTCTSTENVGKKSKKANNYTQTDRTGATPIEVQIQTINFVLLGTKNNIYIEFT